MLRACAAAALALLSTCVDANLATGTPPSLYDYDYNGLTTYCYWVKQPLNVTSFDYSYVKLEGKGKQCPLEISITQTTTGTILAETDVQYQFVATLNFQDNSFGMTGLEAIVLDPATKRPVQIAHANVHACSRSTVCDVFRDGANRRISNQETSNFTADNTATFNQRVNFAAAGEYNVFAHIVLPPKNALEETYQFVTFTTTTVTGAGGSTSSANEADANAGGLSTGAMIGIIVGAVALLLAIVIGVIFYRRKKPAMSPGHDHFRNSGYTPSRTAKSKTSRLDWNGDPEFQFGHDRYQASMVSEYSKQAPSLNASALMFQDNRSSRHTKQNTSSSGTQSNRSGGSPRFRDNGRRTQGVQLPPDHGINTYDTYYHDGRGYGGDNSTLHSYATESSMGTTNAYPSNAHLYPPSSSARVNGGGSGSGSGSRGIVVGYDAPPVGYDRESDLSSLNDDYDFDSHHGDGPDGLHTVSELDRDSNASLGTVDFALPPPLPLNSALRPTGDSFRAEDVPNLADTKLAFNDDEISKDTIEYIESLRKKNYRDTEQASDYVSDFGSTNRTFDFRDSAQSDNMYGGESFRSSTDDQFTDTAYRQNRATSNDSESYEF